MPRKKREPLDGSQYRVYGPIQANWRQLLDPEVWKKRVACFADMVLPDCQWCGGSLTERVLSPNSPIIIACPTCGQRWRASEKGFVRQPLS